MIWREDWENRFVMVPGAVEPDFFVDMHWLELNVADALWRGWGWVQAPCVRWPR